MITISSSQQALLKRNYKIASNVSVKDGSGTWRSLTDLLNRNWVKEVEINHDIDSPVATASIELEKGVDKLCISPFNEVSLLNRLSGSYSPVLDIGREIKIDIQLVSDYNITPSSWLTIFQGYIDTINISQDGSVSLECRDLGARVQDTFIEEERVYSDNNGKPVEQIMQQILNDNGLSSITLYVPTFPGWYIKKYKQEKVGVLDALQSLADQIGWSVKYKFRSSDSTWQFTLWCPERSATTPLYTFERNSILNVRNLSIDISGIRNVISVWYGPANNRQRVVASDSNSINTYGRRFMEIQESSTSEIDTYSEAYTLANNVLNDLKSPKAEIEITTFLFPFVELGDLYRFQGENDLFTSDLDLAVVSYTHSITSSEFTTTLRCRGKPAGAYLRWHANNVVWTGAKDTIPPAMPTGAQLKSYLEDQGSGQKNAVISVGWNANTEVDLKGYSVRIRKIGESTYTTAETGSTLYIFKDLQKNTQYGVQVRAFDIFGNYSDWSNEITIYTPGDSAPAIPSGLTLATGADPPSAIGSITAYIVASWNANSEGDLAGYEVRLRKGTESNYTYITTKNTSHTFRGLAMNTQYRVSVRAFNLHGKYSDWSTEQSITTSVDTTPPSAPTITDIAPISGGFRVILSPSTDPDWDGFEIHASHIQGFTPGSSTLVARGKQNAFDVVLLKTQLYYVKAIAYDITGNKSDPSNEVSVITSPSLDPYVSKIQFDTFFDSIDGFTINVTGSGNISVNGQYLRLSTGTTNNSTAEIKKDPSIRIVEPSWDKPRRFKTAVNLPYTTYLLARIGTGYPIDGKAIFFKIVGGGSSATLYGCVMNNGNETSIQLATNFAGGVLEAIYIPSNGVYFYLNEVQVGSITNNLPSGTYLANNIFYASITNTTTANRELRLSEWHFIQED